MLADSERRELAHTLWKKSGLRSPPEVTGEQADRWSGDELGREWAAFEVEVLWRSTSRLAQFDPPYFQGLAAWGNGPVDLTHSPDGVEGVRLLTFRLVRHRQTGSELGAVWQPKSGSRIVRVDAPGNRTKDALGREWDVQTLLEHVAWRTLRRPTSIVLKRRGPPKGSGTFKDAEECRDALATVIRLVHRSGHKPTQGAVAEYFQRHSSVDLGDGRRASTPEKSDERTLRYWLVHHRLGSWQDLVQAALSA